MTTVSAEGTTYKYSESTKVVPVIVFTADAEPDTRTRDGNTPLSLACHKSRSRTISLLLQRYDNLSVNNQDKDNDTPLLYTTFNGNLHMSRLLLSKGARADLENREQTTPVWNAVFSGEVPLVKLLLRHNVRLQVPSRGINQRAASSQATPLYAHPISPLRVACQRRNHAAFELLVDAGAAERVSESDAEWMAAMTDETDAEWLAHLRRMRSLKSLARRTVRRACSGSFEDRMAEFELPRELCGFLLFLD